MATSRTESLVLIKDVTADGSTRMNSEMYKPKLSALIVPDDTN